jgi:hypothetical protein
MTPIFSGAGLTRGVHVPAVVVVETTGSEATAVASFAGGRGGWCRGGKDCAPADPIEARTTINVTPSVRNSFISFPPLFGFGSGWSTMLATKVKNSLHSLL